MVAEMQELECADEGTATPTHNEKPMDSRLLDAMDNLKASVEYNARTERWLVTTDLSDGYKGAYFGHAGKSLRAVLTGWLLREPQ